MASQSDSSVSVELGELLELLNALEAQDSRPLENFATLERLLAAGKGGPAESSSGDHQPDDHQPDDYQRDAHQPDDHQLDDYQLDDHPSEVGFGDGISDAAEQSSSEEMIAHLLDWREENGLKTTGRQKTKLQTKGPKPRSKTGLRYISFRACAKA